MSLFFLILGIILARLFWRQLVMVAAAATLILACALLWRAAPSIGLSSSWLTTSYGGAVVGLIIGVLLSWRIVVNFLVESDYQRDIERARQNADKRRV